MRMYLLLLIASVALSFIATALVRWACLKWKILPPLRARDIQTTPVPRLGGVGVTIGFVIAMLLARAIPYLEPIFETSAPWTIMAAALGMMVLGVVDDIWELDWIAKLSGQILIAGGMAFGGVQLFSLPIFGLTIASSRFNFVVTVLIIVTIVNAVNFIDGLDGLAGGILAIGGSAFLIYSYVLARIIGAASYASLASVVMVCMVGACLGFLWFNIHPSSIMLGGGAETLGLILAASGVLVTGQIDPVVLGTRQVVSSFLPILLPLSVIFIPMGNFIVTSVRRVAKGLSPFHADRSHFHDELLKRGHSHRSVVALLWLWAAIAAFSAVGLLLVEVQWVFIVLVPVVAVAVLLTRRDLSSRQEEPQDTPA